MWQNTTGKKELAEHNFKTDGNSHWDVLLNTASFFDLELIMTFPQRDFWQKHVWKYKQMKKKKHTK